MQEPDSVHFFQGFHLPRSPFPKKGFWIKDRAFVSLPPDLKADKLKLEWVAVDGFKQNLSIEIFLNGKRLGIAKARSPGPQEDVFTNGTEHRRNSGSQLLELRLHGVGLSNFLAWLSRKLSKYALLQTASAKLAEYRKQEINQLFQVRKISADACDLLNFEQPDNPYLPKWNYENWNVGLNVIGFFRQEFGIGQGARSSASIVRHSAIPHSLIQAPFRGKVPDSNKEYEDDLSKKNTYPINLFHVHPEGMPLVIREFEKSFFRNKYNIACWHWELPLFPQQWLQHFDQLQEIWVPTRYVFDAIHPVSPVPVQVLPHTIQCPSSEAKVDRGKFGLPEEKFIFLTMFDLNSTRMRKNPDGALTAFKRLRAKHSGCHLAVKVHNTFDYPEDFAEIKEKCDQLEDVSLLTKTLDNPEVHRLQNSCDALLSLHRAEGFGLILAECMAKGKPVIATNWSGNIDFMDQSNSFPVHFELVPIEASQGPYSAGQTWAEPDIDHAVSQMTKAMNDPTESKRRGTKAKNDIEETLSPERIGQQYKDRLLAIRKNTFFQSSYP